jgi:glucose/arabinose dehydrogenase
MPITTAPPVTAASKVRRVSSTAVYGTRPEPGSTALPTPTHDVQHLQGCPMTRSRRPRRRLLLAVLGVLVVVAGVAAWVRRDDVAFVAKLAVPGPTYDAAAARSSEPAPVGRALALPATKDVPAPPASEPSVVVGETLPLAGASALADPPGPGPVLVSSLDGRVHAVDLDSGTSEVVLDLSAEISTGGERGLLGIAVPTDGSRLFVDYTNRRGDTEIRSYALRGAQPQGEGVLHLEIGQPFENHNGGNLVFGPDGALWIGVGDGGGAGDRGDKAQDPDSLLGKMLRVVPDPDGGVRAPSTNGAPGARPEVWGVGLRNPWRYSFDRATNRLWIADVGQNTIEEVTVVDPQTKEANFGWNTVEGNNDYEGEPSRTFSMPAITYGHDLGCSITGGYVYRGSQVPELYGWYLYSDYCTGFLAAVPSDDPDAEPARLATDLGNVISFGELDDGELVVLTTEGIARLLPPAPTG